MTTNVVSSAVSVVELGTRDSWLLLSNKSLLKQGCSRCASVENFFFFLLKKALYFFPSSFFKSGVRAAERGSSHQIEIFALHY